MTTSIDQIYDLDSLDDLKAFLAALPEKRTRNQLIKQFHKFALYRNVAEWNKAVRLCEALTIVGWGNYEAVRGKCFNGNPNTTFLNRDYEERFVTAGWSKRKTGYTIYQDDSYNYGSPDVPDMEEGDYDVEECIQDIKPAAQRNWIPRSPVVVFRTISNCHPGSEEFAASVEEQLMPTLHDQMRAAEYGDAIDRIQVVFSLSYEFKNYIVVDEDLRDSSEKLHQRLRTMMSDDEIKENRYSLRPRYSFGGFRKAKGTMNIEIHLPREFSDQSTKKQKREFADHLRYVVAEAATRLEKKKVSYDFEAMQSDFRRVVGEWSM